MIKVCICPNGIKKRNLIYFSYKGSKFLNTDLFA